MKTMKVVAGNTSNKQQHQQTKVTIVTIATAAVMVTTRISKPNLRWCKLSVRGRRVRTARSSYCQAYVQTPGAERPRSRGNVMLEVREDSAPVDAQVFGLQHIPPDIVLRGFDHISSAHGG